MNLFFKNWRQKLLAGYHERRDRDPLKVALDPYHDWARLFRWWVPAVALLLAGGAAASWWLGQTPTRAERSATVSVAPAVSAPRVGGVAAIVAERSAKHREYLTASTTLFVDPSR